MALLLASSEREREWCERTAPRVFYFAGSGGAVLSSFGWYWIDHVVDGVYLRNRNDKRLVDRTLSSASRGVVSIS